MVFKWQMDGYFEVEVIGIGKILKGLAHEQRRPETVELTREELKYLMDNPQYVRMLFNSLK